MDTSNTDRPASVGTNPQGGGTRVILKPGGAIALLAALGVLAAVTVQSVARARNAERRAVAAPRPPAAPSGTKPGQALLPAAVPPVPAALRSGEGLLIDGYDSDTPFFGAGEPNNAGDKARLGRLRVALAPHPDGAGGFLFGDFDVAPGQFAFLWAQAGQRWGAGSAQDWRGARAVTFLAYVTRPMDLTFTFYSGDDSRHAEDGRPFTAVGQVAKAREWHRVTIPIEEFSEGGKGIGWVSKFIVNVPPGSGQFALDDLRVVGGRQSGV